MTILSQDVVAMTKPDDAPMTVCALTGLAWTNTTVIVVAIAPEQRLRCPNDTGRRPWKTTD